MDPVQKPKGSEINIIHALLTIVILVWLALLFNNGDVNKPDLYGRKEDAPVGQLTPGFKSEMILQPAGNLQSSYSINYINSQQRTAEFFSDNNIEQEYNEYLKYFSDHKFSILNKSYKNNTASIYAKSSDLEVNVVITSQNNKTRVLISQLTK